MKSLFRIFILSALSLLFSGVSGAINMGIIQEGYYVEGLSNLRGMKNIPALTIDHVDRNGFEVYGPQGLGAWLQRNRLKFSALQPNRNKGADNYPSPEEVVQELVNVAKAYPNLVQLTSIGKSVKGRDLVVVKIASNVKSVNDTRPEFKYIANMHGDEIVGRELMVLLIKDLVSNYGKDPAITQLVDATQIYIMPSMNPDGAAARARSNANYIDLNRNFPDFTTSDTQDNPAGRAIETQAVMNWQAQHKFVLSANFHGGAEVVNYLWDTTGQPHPKLNWLQALSLGYAQRAPYIGASTVFKNGITNGFEWYEVNGGMQDWSTYYRGDLQFTIELSDEKWPDFGKIPYYYQQNRNAMLYFISQVHTVVRSSFIPARH